MAADITPSAGVVTIDDTYVNDTLLRVSSTGNITSWDMREGADANPLPDGFNCLIALTRETSTTVAFTNLADVWVGTPPSPSEGQTVYFPVMLDGTTWVARGNTTGGGGGDTAYTTYQTAGQGSGAITVDAALGYLVDIVLTGNVTSLTVNSLDDRKEMSIWFLQGSGGYDINLGAGWNLKGGSFTWSSAQDAVHEIIVWKRGSQYFYQNAGSTSAAVLQAQVRLTGARLTAVES